MRYHFLNYWPIYLLGLTLSLIVGGLFLYEYLYPCVSGHYEDVWHTTFGANGMINGGYYSNDFVCDCRTERDSIK